MKTQLFAILSLFLFALNLKGYSQTEKYKINAIAISLPIIWNNSEATYYILGSPKHPNGNAISYGLNVNYSRTIYKKLFALAGIGYFKQKFGIKRPFEYTAPDGTKPAVYTEYYAYYNIYLLLGVGYQKILTKNLSINGKVLCNVYNSFKQKYSQKYFPNSNEINKKSLSIGSMISFDLGMERFINNKISIGTGIVLPLYTKWNKDAIFFRNGYSSNEQQIARNKFSIGIAFSCYYHL